MKIWVVVKVHEGGSAKVLAAFTDRDEANNFAADVDFYNCELLETTLEGQIASLEVAAILDSIADFHQGRDLTPAQAAALDAAAARPPKKIKARDLPSRKRK